jgi:hypothetical protein
MGGRVYAVRFAVAVIKAGDKISVFAVLFCLTGVEVFHGVEPL